MARLTAAPISLRQHFAAVAYLRLRLFLNGFRRKGGKGELAARLITFPVLALFVIGPIVAAGSAAYAAASRNNLDYLQFIFWAIFVGQVVLSINIAPPGLSFDPESLIRFPLSFARYLTIRLFLGLLAVSTVVGTLALLSTAIGITLAAPVLAPVAFAVALTLAFCNMLFTRMVFSWVDRWLSTRRARELFTALFFAVSIGIQYLNVTFNGIGRNTSPAQQQVKIAAAIRVYHTVQPTLAHLPPGLAGASLLAAGRHHLVPAVISLLGILLYAAAFLAIFANRIYREYRGENLSQSSASATTVLSPAHLTQTSVLSTEVAQSHQATPWREPRLTSLRISPVLTACLRKELLYVRRNTTQFYGLIAPLAMAFLFVGRAGALTRTGYAFPAVATYSLLGISALAHNCFGLEGSGIQFYFIAPILLRSVIFAKNLFGFLITIAQLALVYLLLCFTAGRPSLLITLTTLCWAVFATLSNVTLGNVRSITTPRKIDPSKLSRRQASQLSALMSIALMLTLAAIGFGLLTLAKVVSLPWLPIPILLALAAGAFVAYRRGLNRTDTLALNHRETLIEELSKAS